MSNIKVSRTLVAVSSEVRRRIGFAAILLTAALVFGLTYAARETRAQEGNEIPFGDAQIRIEVNSTDGDAGLQIFLDGEAWKQIRIEDPRERLVFEVDNFGKFRRLGSTELFMESNEPDFQEDMSLPAILKLLPAGVYDFEGTTIDGEELEGEAELTHDLPCGPEVTSPMDGDTLDPAQPVVIMWEPVTHKLDKTSATGECSASTDIVIVAYEVIVELEGAEPPQKMDIFLPAGATQVTVPAELIVAGGEYKFEVLAIEESGNQTITEGIFMTSN
ncbi:MAG TPA: hypothetical protein VLG45_00685 [Thermodesulfobacteriota bacterium]|nr:hypothetical protein [Thermodesulfobacteriota bacterium]